MIWQPLRKGTWGLKKENELPIKVGREAPLLANRSAELAIVDVELINTCSSLNDDDRI